MPFRQQFEYVSGTSSITRVFWSDYRGLSSALKRLRVLHAQEPEGDAVDKLAAEFISSMTDTVDRLWGYVNSSFSEAQSTVNKLLITVRHSPASVHPSVHQHAMVLVATLLDLNRFIFLNHEALDRVALKYDHIMGCDSGPSTPTSPPVPFLSNSSASPTDQPGSLQHSYFKTFSAQTHEAVSSAPCLYNSPTYNPPNIYAADSPTTTATSLQHAFGPPSPSDGARSLLAYLLKLKPFHRVQCNGLLPLISELFQHLRGELPSSPLDRVGGTTRRGTSSSVPARGGSVPQAQSAAASPPPLPQTSNADPHTLCKASGGPGHQATVAATGGANALAPGALPLPKAAVAAAAAQPASARVAPPKAPKAGDNDTFDRVSYKYWVPPWGVVPVLLHTISNLPYHTVSAAAVADPSITSVYLDTAKLELYHERVARIQGAALVRLRWYGGGASGGGAVGTVFVERKLHHEPWVADRSVKQRFAIPCERVAEFLRGDWRPGGPQRSLAVGRPSAAMQRPATGTDARPGGAAPGCDLVEEVAARIAEEVLVPRTRSKYDRCAFQHVGDASVRISLDTNLMLSTETPSHYGTGVGYGGVARGYSAADDDAAGGEAAAPSAPATPVPAAAAPGVAPASWCATARDTERHFAFPYAILEVKLQATAATCPPGWVRELMRSRLIEPVPKFSKYATSVAVHYERDVVVNPYWLPQMNNVFESYVDAIATTTKAGGVTPGGSAAYGPGAQVPGDAGGAPSRIALGGAAASADAAARSGEVAAMLAAYRGGGTAIGDLTGYGSAPHDGGRDTMDLIWLSAVLPESVIHHAPVLPATATGASADGADIDASSGCGASLGGTPGGVRGFLRRAATPLFGAPGAVTERSSLLFVPGERNHGGLEIGGSSSGGGAAAWSRLGAAGGPTGSATWGPSGGPPGVRRYGATAAASAVPSGAFGGDARTPAARAAAAAAAASGPGPGGAGTGFGAGATRPKVVPGGLRLDPPPPPPILTRAILSLSNALLPAWMRDLVEAIHEPDAPGGLEVRSGEGRRRVHVPVRVEPKTFFANERTFLHWLSVAVMIGLMAITLLKDHDVGVGRFSSLIMLFAAFFLILYALTLYYYRAVMINRGSPIRYDDTRGPVVLAAALMLSFVLTVMASITHDKSPTPVYIVLPDGDPARLPEWGGK